MTWGKLPFLVMAILGGTQPAESHQLPASEGMSSSVLKEDVDRALIRVHTCSVTAACLMQYVPDRSSPGFWLVSFPGKKL